MNVTNLGTAVLTVRGGVVIELTVEEAKQLHIICDVFADAAGAFRGMMDDEVKLAGRLRGKLEIAGVLDAIPIKRSKR